MSEFEFGLFCKSDLRDIAALHALSWQRHYRGILPDSYLDHDVESERLQIWSERFAQSDSNLEIITLKHQDRLIGFSGFFINADENYGTYIDNLHVLREHQGHHLGRRLMVKTAEYLLEKSHHQAMHLYVFEENHDAIGFYEYHDGQHIWTKPFKSPGGVEPPVRLYHWSDLNAFVERWSD